MKTTHMSIKTYEWIKKLFYVCVCVCVCVCMYSIPGGSVVKNPSAGAGDMGLIPGLGRSPGEESGYPLQYCCLGNPMDRGTRWAVCGVSKNQT